MKLRNLLRVLICALRGHDRQSGTFDHGAGERHLWTLCRRCGRRDNVLEDPNAVLPAHRLMCWIDWERPGTRYGDA